METQSQHFYEQLKKMIEDPSETLCHECCITQTPLLEDHVTLECGHKFNYDAIFNEIYQQKCVFRTYTLMSAIHHIEAKFNSKKECTYFIKCPYCRNVQFSLIPPKEGCKSVYGINSDQLTNEDIPYLLNTPPDVWIHKNMIFKCHEGKQCDAGPDCVFFMIGKKTTHFPKINKYYCMHHAVDGLVATKEMEKIEKLQAKIKAKEEAKKEKLQAKMKEKQEKLEAKMKEKQEKLEAKMEAKIKAKEEAKKTKQDAKKTA
jgi:hypothetical protein